jgi:hypothetical protein
MKRTSARVHRGGSIFASSSAESVVEASPGEPGWTMFGAVSPAGSDSSSPPHAARRAAAAAAARTVANARGIAAR